MLRICKAPIELLTQREHLDMVENLIRGGINSVYSKRFAVANNNYLGNFYAQKPSAFIIMIDANNLYGGVMENFCLPLNDFGYIDQVWDSEFEPELIQKNSRDWRWQWCWLHRRSRPGLSQWSSRTKLWLPFSTNKGQNWCILAEWIPRRTFWADAGERPYFELKTHSKSIPEN